MRGNTVFLSLFLLFCFVTTSFAQEEPKPEAIAGKMAFKFTRGITNVATAIVELPKQSYLTVRDQGGVGYVIGPIKGIGMTIYRALVGTAETVLCLVPQPGYYDPMIDPDFVWNGWEEHHPDYIKARHAESPETTTDKKGE